MYFLIVLKLRVVKSSKTTSLVARLDHRRSKADQLDFRRLLEHVLRRENLGFSKS